MLAGSSDREKGALLRELEVLWKKLPEPQPGQLLSTVINSSDIYYVTDEDLLNKLKNYYDTL